MLIPQSVGLAALAGLPPEQGLYAAAFAPLATAVLSSSPYLQAGPTAMTSLLTLGGLAAIATPFTPRYVALAGLLALVVGVTRIVLGLIRAGFLSYLMSQPVVVGFSAAAGVLIVLSQVPAVLGAAPTSSNPVVAAFDAVREPGAWDPASVVLAAVCLVVILGGRRLHPLFPGVLVATGLALAWSVATGFDGSTVGSLRPGLPPLSADLPWSDTWRLLLPGVVIALVGFAEPAAIARHYAAAERQMWDPNREFVSQGVANVVAGFTGGYPIGGSFSRSALSKLAGAKTRWSGVIASLGVIAFLPAMDVLSPLPRAAVGATVMAAAFSLVNPKPFREYRRYSPLQFAIAVATFAATVAFAPHVERGVLVGVGLAIGTHLWRELKLSIPSWVEGQTIHVQPRGVLYFASSPGLDQVLVRLLAEHPDARRMVVHLDGLGRVDLTGALALRGVVLDAKAAGLDVRLEDVPPQARRVVERVIAEEAPVGRLAAEVPAPNLHVRSEDSRRRRRSG
jgi:SulP family sulfate permease